MTSLATARLGRVRTAAVALVLVLGVSAAPVAAMPGRAQQMASAVAPAPTAVPVFFGSGSGPASPMLFDQADDPRAQQMSRRCVARSSTRWSPGSRSLMVAFTADESVASLGAAIEAYTGLASDPQGMVGDLYSVPALTALSTADYLSVSSKLIELAARRNGMALLEPPTAMFDEVVATNDVTPVVDFANQIRASVGFNAAGHAALYSGGVTNFDIGMTTSAQVVPVPLVGPVSGVIAATDEREGVWSAPAGTAASLDAYGLPFSPTNEQLGELEAAGVNSTVLLPQVGPVVWGAVTLARSGGRRYISTARLVDFIARSLPKSLQWTVFEQNGPWLWSTVEASVTAFLSSLQSQGAFFGTDPFQVAVDDTTMTTADIAARRVVGSIDLDFGPIGTATVAIEATAGQ